jgi:hypothetical protein
MKNCSHFRKLAYLYRDGECTESQANEWIAHRKNCPKCDALAGQIAALNNRIAQTRSQSAKIKSPESLTQDVLRILARDDVKPGSGWNALFTLIRQPKFQFAQAMLLVVLISGFFWENQLSTAAIQELSLTRMMADHQNRTLTPSLPRPPGMLANQSCLGPVREWISQQIPGSLASQKGTHSSLLSRSNRDWRAKKSELVRLLLSCGFSKQETEYILSQGVTYVQRYFSI